MYDDFSVDYDRFVNWPSRLALELPFLEKEIQSAAQPGRTPRVLDAACGTGMHGIALAQKGYAVAGADLSSGMVAKARKNAAAAGVDVPFVAAGFGELQETMAKSRFFPFDCLLCLGNSLPHLLTPGDLAAALQDFAAVLRFGGRLVLQNRNFDRVMANQARWMEPESHREAEREWVFWRFYDFEPGGLISFNLLTLTRGENEPWQQRVVTSKLRPLLAEELTQAVAAAGFSRIVQYGALDGSPFSPQESGNLVITAEKE